MLSHIIRFAPNEACKTFSGSNVVRVVYLLYDWSLKDPGPVK